jgi:GTPase
MYGKTPNVLARHVNQNAQSALAQDIDVLVYLVDRTRPRDFEENQILGMVRKAPAPKILVFNKSDLNQEYEAEYAFYEEEFENIIEVSALHRWNFNLLLNKVFELLPEGKPLVDKSKLVQPGLNLDSKLFLSEIIREKVFLFMREEIPYSVTTQVDEISNRDNGTLFISGRIITNDDKYKKMLIGKAGFMIKKIGMAVRKEIEQMADREVFVDLSVEVDTHWTENL